MKTGARILSVVVALTVLAAGPLAPLAAAQQPAAPPPTEAAQQPAPTAPPTEAAQQAAPTAPPTEAAQQPAPTPPPTEAAQQPAPTPPPPEVAQQPTPTPPPTVPAQQPTPPPPAVPAQQATPQPADPMQARGDRLDSETAAYHVGAGIANVFYIPGKAILCFLGAASGIFVMFVSIGSAPKTAAFFAREGCGGRWILTGDDIKPDADVRRFDWERDGKD